MTRAADKSVEWPEREEAFKVLIGPRLDRAYGLAWHVLGAAADAEDACQEALLAAWSAWPRLRDPARFDAWFDRILVAGATRDSSSVRRAGRVYGPEWQRAPRIRWDPALAVHRSPRSGVHE
jgi:DNA-directed RNA polymerase specialized sigma24 family protein